MTFLGTVRTFLFFEEKRLSKNSLIQRSMNVRSLLLYRFTCSSCNSAYIGKTKRYFLVHMFEYLGIYLSTDNNYTFNPKNNNNNAAVLNQINCNILMLV